MERPRAAVCCRAERCEDVDFNHFVEFGWPFSGHLIVISMLIL